MKATLTVAENLAFWAAVYGTDRAGEAMARMNLIELKDRLAANLSAGQKRRLHLMLALTGNPDIVFLDEPTAGLDPIGADAFDRLILELRDSLNLSVFMVTHDLDTLHTCCDRIAVLSDKRVLASGTIPELLKVDDPWIHEYFHGPRARAAFSTDEGKEQG